MPFKVVIVGGSVAGLTTALLLERAGIDYILLEAYKHIAPQVGASLGLWPNGFRILDQLGVYEDIRKVTVPNFRNVIHGKDGSVLQKATGDKDLVEDTLGYPSVFLDRMLLIQILHQHIEHKDRILTSKRVTSVEETEDGVVVKVEDGSTYEGDLVIGADGVHSAVRSEMWRLIEKNEPSLLDPNERFALTAEYFAMFGISEGVPTIKETYIHLTFGGGVQFMVVGGKDGRIFWFIFGSLDKHYTAPNIPRFTAEDCAREAEKHMDSTIMENTKFRDLWEKKITATYVPLEESSFHQWAYGRLALVGDSIHKMTPSSGQGGNGAIESAAVLVNLLHKALQNHKQCGDAHLSKEEIGSILVQYKEIRADRVSKIIQDSHNLTASSTLSPFMETLISNIAPYLPSSLLMTYLLNSMLKPIMAAPRVEFLPIVHRPHQKLWDDEMPPIPRTSSSYMISKLPSQVQRIFG